MDLYISSDLTVSGVGLTSKYSAILGRFLGTVRR